MLKAYQTFPTPTKLVTLTRLASLTGDAALVLSSDGGLTHEWLGKATAEGTVDGQGRLSPKREGRLLLNGVPARAGEQLRSGDVISLLSLCSYRVAIDGEAAEFSPAAAAESFASAVRIGLLEVEGTRAVWRCDRHREEELALFCQSALASRLDELEVVVGVDAPTVARALQPIAAKCTFVLLGREEAPPDVRVRVPAEVDVLLDGVRHPPGEALWLRVEEERLVASEVFAAGPRLELGRGGAVLTFGEGPAPVTAFRRPGSSAHATPHARSCVPMLEGDEWELHTATTRHRLKLVPREEAVRRAPPPEPPPYVFEGREYRELTLLRPDAGDVTLSQGRDGLFRGAHPTVLGVHDGRLRLLGHRDQWETAMYQPLDVLKPELVLPRPSPFLRGFRELFDEGVAPLELVRALESRDDGASLAFRRFLEGPPEQAARWFKCLLTHMPLRTHLGDWLDAEARHLRVLPQELTVSNGHQVVWLLAALAIEPMFGFVRVLRVVDDGRGPEYWWSFVEYFGRFPRVRLEQWREGRVVKEHDAGPMTWRPGPEAIEYLLGACWAASREHRALPSPRR